ncbi:MAG: septum formation protein Maf [Betaproteobacteria bacterium RIFCSPLOWO2_02_FULL_65_24]|nr:MAG: septum formation protein Maf [Betaproteobacteria bacterium RIFCSPLOWO2_02_FULL_65_24]
MLIGQSYFYLASRSPRRRELLHQIGVDHQVLTQRIKSERGSDVNEDPLPGEKPRDYVLRVCRDKAESGWNRVIQRKLPLRGVLAADTTVCIGDEILGTPVDAAEAADFLARLSGREHEVLTAIAFKFGERMETGLSATAVRFRALERAEIERYVAGGEPMDKAGAYGIQGHAGAFIIEIRGSYSGVMGLPLYETAQLLKRFGIGPAA